MKRDRVYVMPTWLSVVAINYEEHAINSAARYTPVDHKMNEEILEELHVTSFEEKLCAYRYNWFRHVPRMEDYRLPKQLLKFHPKGRRWPGRPLKRLLDDVNAETEKGHPGLNSWWNMRVMIMMMITTTTTTTYYDDRIDSNCIYVWWHLYIHTHYLRVRKKYSKKTF
jgi:hypothetical protein